MPSISVLESPAVQLSYAPIEELATLNAIVASSISAFKDESGQVQDLSFGASANVVIEASKNVQTFMGSNGEFQVYHTTYDAEMETRFDDILLKVSGEPATTVISTGSNEMKVATTDENGLIAFNDLEIKDVNNFKFLGSMQPNGIWIDDKVAFGSNLHCVSDVVVENNMYTQCNVSAHDLLLFKDLTSSNINDPIRIGYAFKINSNDQLELIKYTRFLNNGSDAMRRVMVFGISDLGSTEPSDATAQDYTNFSDVSSTNFRSGMGASNFGPMEGGSVVMNILETPNAVITLEPGATPLTIVFEPLTADMIGAKGVITIIEKSTTGRSVETNPQLTFASGLDTITTTPASGNIDGYAVDVIDYTAISPTTVIATYANKIVR